MITVTRATGLDSEDLFQWRNDRLTLQASVSHEPVSREEHDAWMSAVLASPSRRLFIAWLPEQEGGPKKVGMCRFDTKPDGISAEVSINLNPDCRGRGLAVSVLRAAIDEFRREVGPGPILTATIRKENSASIKVFEHIGFELSSSDDAFNYYLARGTCTDIRKTTPS